MTTTEKKIHLITTYEALFNDVNMTCAITISSDQFDITPLIDKDILFSVDYQSSNIRVQTDKDLYVFLNADKELIYYASKTDKLAILYGPSNPPEVKGAVIAMPNFNE